MLVAEDEAQSVLTATEQGYGKRTPIVEYSAKPRHEGNDRHQQSSRNGQVIGAALVRPDDEVVLISTSGVLIRTSEVDPRNEPLDAVRYADQPRQGREARRTRTRRRAG
jgi:DNA gyrase subunit A